jgi:acetylornithine/succinyldiaminopimelate/putrescine aminotransferase
VETVQGEGGVNIGDGDFLRGVERLCRERGAMLVIDEIQTGFGRTGVGLAASTTACNPT